MATQNEIDEQKARLPMGWGRFGKALDHFAAVTDADEHLLAACVTLNPSFVHRSITLVGGLAEMTNDTNVVLGATDRRLVVIATGMSGAPRAHSELAYAGLAIAASDKKEITLTWPDGTARFKGAAKPMLGALVSALDERIRASNP